MDRVVAQTKYSRKQHKEFYMFHLFHRTGTVVFVGVLSLIMLILAISNTINKDFSEKANMSAAIFSWIMFAISLSFTPIMIITRINNVIKNETEERKRSTDKIEVTKMKFSRSNNIIEGKSVFGWNDIDMLCETDKYFYIYLTNENGIFIVKDDIIEGSVELFRKMALANLRKDKKGRPLYKRYGQVKAEYNAIKRQEKLKKKQEKKNDK